MGDWTQLMEFKNKKERFEHIKAVLSGSFAYDIEQIMKKEGLTKRQLAEKLGVSKNLITRIMYNKIHVVAR